MKIIKKFFLVFYIIAMLNMSIAMASEGIDKPLPKLKQPLIQQLEDKIHPNETGRAEEVDKSVEKQLPVDTVERQPLMQVIFKMLKSLLAVVVLILLLAGAIKLFLALKNKVSIDESEKLQTEPSNISEAVSSFVKNNLD